MPTSPTIAEARSTTYLTSRLQNPTPSTSTTPPDFQIPTIDLSPSFSPSLSSRHELALQIHNACLTTGFFCITNHGVSASSRDAILHQASRFTKDLAPEKKEALHLRNSKLGYGWEPGNYTSLAGDVETKEAFNFGYEAGFDSTGGDGAYCNLDGSGPEVEGNWWPAEEDLPGFKEAVGGYYGEVLDLARRLLRVFALGLGVREGYFDGMVTHPGGIVRLLYYPPSKEEEEEEEEEEDIGLGAHSDYECFTILHSSSVPGLEILTPSNTWHRVAPTPNSFIVNVADFLMRWTNGLYKSTIHRVVNRSAEERYSVPFFFSVNYDEVVDTLETCVSKERPKRYGPIRAGEYILERLNTTTKGGKGYFGNEDVFGEKGMS
ncbi:Clavaminate synthase-like protein [Amniculicola lignicola CBS 123094]|uniref:Clavaminate synthase-like protein n=1 Tax=Amniculicola lignicola CBS 123094 TaxID=1392246 RepID=A0A6A5WKG6_9PLEO|nr:Clavaminate synthase-like protein [Amniculicola lignicola CBS 123094]